MQFNPDYDKQVQKVYFSKKWNNENFHPVTFNNSKVLTCFTQNHIGLLMDQRLNFNQGRRSRRGHGDTGPPVLN